jgi:hypothetical protein
MESTLHGLRERDTHRRIAALAMRYVEGRAELLDLRASGFPCPASLAHHDDALRAHGRALDELRRSGPTGMTTDDFVRLQTACLHHLERGRIRLVLVGGTLDSGAAALAGALGAKHGAVVLRADEIDAAELFRRAARLLHLGEQVVIDAPWTSAVDRQQAREIAFDTGSDLVELWVHDAAADRAAPSDGAFDPWPEATRIGPEDGLDHRLDHQLDRQMVRAAAACGWAR